MRMLTQGDKGSDVMFAQNLFNKIALANSLKDYLIPDCDFGPKTKKAILDFQKWFNARYGAFIPVTGDVCGATWRALDAGPYVSHTVRLIPQRSDTTCWEACMNMILGAALCREIPAAHVEADGSLKKDAASVRHYASMLGRRATPAPTSVVTLHGLVARRPAVVLGRSTRYPTGGHAIVVSGVWTDKTGDADVAVLRVFNPSPVNYGRVESSPYPRMMAERENFDADWVIA